VRLSVLALFIVPLLRKGGLALVGLVTARQQAIAYQKDAETAKQ
jgi:hypothetical protein